MDKEKLPPHMKRLHEAFKVLTEKGLTKDEINEVYDATRNFSAYEDWEFYARKRDVLLHKAAPEMYELLKEEIIPTSDYGGTVSFARERKVRELLARIDGINLA